MDKQKLPPLPWRVVLYKLEQIKHDMILRNEPQSFVDAIEQAQELVKEKMAM